MILGQTRFRHDGPVHQLAILPDDRVLTASAYLEVRLWSLEGRALGRPLRLGNPRPGTMHHYSLSQERPWIAAGDVSQPGLWNVESHELLLALPDILTVRLSPDSRWLAHAHTDGLTLWDVERRQPLWFEECRPDVNVAPCFSPDSSEIVVPRRDGNWLRIHVRSRERSELPRPKVWVETALTADGQLLAPESDGALYVNGRAIAAHRNACCAVAVDGSRCFTAGWDGRVVEWDTATWEPVRERRHPEVRCVAVRGDLVAVGGERHDVSLYRGDEVLLGPTGTGAVTTLVQGPQLISGGTDALVRCWGDGRILEATGPVIALALSPDGRWLAAGAQRGLRVWDLRTGGNVALQPAGDVVGRWERGLGTSENHSVVRREGDLGFSADSRQLTALLVYDDIATWDLETGKLVSKEEVAGLYYSCASAVADGRALFGEIGVVVWPDNVELSIGRARVLRVCGDRAACACIQGELMVWTLPDQHVRQVGEEKDVVDLALLPDGRLLTANTEGRFRIWPDGPTWEHPTRANCLVVSDDGLTFSCGNADGTVWKDVPIPT